jgi:hypothetical protein
MNKTENLKNNPNTSVDSTPSTANIYMPLEFWLVLFGSTVYTEICFLILQPTLILIGLVFNIIGFWLLKNEKFNGIKLYAYMRVYLINSAVLCLFLTLSIFLSRRFTDFANNYVSTFITAYIMPAPSLICYLYAGVLDIIIILDRIAMLSNRLKFIGRISPNYLCLALFIPCVIINLNVLFNYYPSSMIIWLSDTEQKMFYYFDLSNMNRTRASNIIVFLQSLLRDMCTFTSQFVLNLVSIYLLKKHLKKKSKLTSVAGRNVANVISLRPIKSNSQTNNIQTDMIRLDSVLNNNEQTNNPLHLNDHGRSNLNSVNVSREKKEKRLNKSELNATLMVMTISAISIIEHSLLFVSFVLNLSAISFALSSTAAVFMAFKHSSNFAVLVLFNKNFRDVFLAKFRMIKVNNSAAQ